MSAGGIPTVGGASIAVVNASKKTTYGRHFVRQHNSDHFCRVGLPVDSGFCYFSGVIIGPMLRSRSPLPSFTDRLTQMPRRKNGTLLFSGSFQIGLTVRAERTHIASGQIKAVVAAN
jgi:hypothetical protein